MRFTLARRAPTRRENASPAGTASNGRPSEQGPAFLQGLVADRGEEPRPDALTAVIPPHEHVTLHDSTVAGGVRPAEPSGNRPAVGGLDQPGVVVELRRQLPREGDVGLNRLRRAIRATFRRDRRLDSVQSRQLFIGTGTKPDPTHVEAGGHAHRHSLPRKPTRGHAKCKSQSRVTAIRRVRRSRDARQRRAATNWSWWSVHQRRRRS